MTWPRQPGGAVPSMSTSAGVAEPCSPPTPLPSPPRPPLGPAPQPRAAPAAGASAPCGLTGPELPHGLASAVRLCGPGTHSSDPTAENDSPRTGFLQVRAPPPHTHFRFFTPGSWPATSSVTCASCVPPHLLAWLPWACNALWALNISGVSALKAFQGAGCPLASAPPNGPPHHGCAHAGAAGRSGGLVAGRGSGFRVQGGPSGCKGSDEGDAC